MSRRRSSVLRTVVVVAMVVSGLTLVHAGPVAAADPCSTGSRTISGTVAGEDGRYVSAQVSFELFDSGGRLVGMDGCPRPSAAYPAIVLVNNRPGETCCFVLPGEGSAASPHDGVDLTTTWTLTGIPDNVAQIWIETYTKRTGGQPNSTTERYGHTIRRVPFAEGSVEGIEITQPLRCGLGGGEVSGSTGQLTGRVFHDGRQVTATRVSAFSTSPDDGNGGGHLSFNVSGLHPEGRYSIDALAPGTYTIFVDAAGASRRIDGLRVEPCRTTTVDVAVVGSVPRVAGTPVVGDWDGDGGTDIGMFRPSTRAWLLRDDASAGPSDRAFGFGGAGDLPVVGDWDGDGDDDIGVFRPSSREWLLRDSAAAGGVHRRFGFGGAGDVPVVGDWDGDGDDDIGVFRPSTREWLLRDSASGGGVLRRFGFGGAGDLPVVGDWDGDGVDGIGAFRPSTGVWLLRETASRGGVQRRVDLSGTGYVPVAGSWDAAGPDGAGAVVASSADWLLRHGFTPAAAELRFAYDGDG